MFHLMGTLGREAPDMITYHGIPADYQQMDGNSVHAYKFINAAGLGGGSRPGRDDQPLNQHPCQ